MDTFKSLPHGVVPAPVDDGAKISSHLLESVCPSKLSVEPQFPTGTCFPSSVRTHVDFAQIDSLPRRPAPL